MVTFEQKIDMLKLYFDKSKNFKEIGKILNLSEQTVRTYIVKFIDEEKSLIEHGNYDWDTIKEKIKKPSYNKGEKKIKKNHVLTDEVFSIIAQMSSEGISGLQIYNKLIEMGYSISYTSVKNARKKLNE